MGVDWDSELYTCSLSLGGLSLVVQKISDFMSIIMLLDY